MASQTGDSSSSFLSSSSPLSDGCKSYGHKGSVRIVTPKSRTAMVCKYHGSLTVTSTKARKQHVESVKRLWYMREVLQTLKIT